MHYHQRAASPRPLCPTVGVSFSFSPFNGVESCLFGDRWVGWGWTEWVRWPSERSMCGEQDCYVFKASLTACTNEPDLCFVRMWEEEASANVWSHQRDTGSFSQNFNLYKTVKCQVLYVFVLFARVLFLSDLRGLWLVVSLFFLPLASCLWICWSLCGESCGELGSRVSCLMWRVSVKFPLKVCVWSTLWMLFYVAE